MPDREPLSVDELAEVEGVTREVNRLVDRVAPLLAGQPSEIQGAALADMLAIWLAGHIVYGDKRGTDRLRERLLREHLRAVRALVPVNAKAIHDDHGGEWREPSTVSALGGRGSRRTSPPPPEISRRS